MIWGYALGWWPEFLTLDEDPLYARLKFLLAHGLKATNIKLEQVLAMPAGERAKLGAFLADNDLQLIPYVWYDYVKSTPDEAKQHTDETIAGLTECLPMLRAWTVVTHSGCGHRFDRTLPVGEKIERLSKGMAPISAACHELGAPLAVNNQGDFYVSDFVELCERTPHLGIHLDTANIFWAGERIQPTFKTIAPYVTGTHWRDERITIGERKPRGVMLHNCCTGDGDVGLEECYYQLVNLAPDPKRLVMEIEMFPPSEMDKTEALEKSLAFIRSLPEVG